MKKEERKKQKRNFFINKVRKEVREMVKEIRENGGHVTPEAREAMMQAVAKRVKKEVGIYAMSLFLGITGSSVATTALLTQGNEGIDKNSKEISINLNEVDEGKEININNLWDREIFINGLRVNVDNLQTHKDNIRKEVEKEIEVLKTKEDVLEYVKELYVREYNENNENKTRKEDVSFYKTRQVAGLESETTKDGKEIYRKNDEGNYGSSTYYFNGIISVYNGLKVEKITGNLKDYYKVYDVDEEVEDANSIAVKMGNVIDSGIDYSTTLGEKGDKLEETYKDRLINAVTAFKEGKIKELAKANIQENTEENTEENVIE